MPLNDSQRDQVRAIVKDSLDDAERVWDEHGHVFDLALESRGIAMDSAMAKAETVPSRIPNHPTVSKDRPKVADFICLVADMRDSSKHLLQAHSRSQPGMEMMKRVYFETAALLPALDMTVGFEGGQVTEYLGDGILALIDAPEDERDDAVRASYRIARNCIGDTRAIVNNALGERYQLPALDIGVGLAFSSAIIQLVGVPGQMHAKAVGPCVYYATKLSGGRNEIFAHENLHRIWPTSKGGKLSFLRRTLRQTEGYLIGRASE